MRATSSFVTARAGTSVAPVLPSGCDILGFENPRVLPIAAIVKVIDVNANTLRMELMILTGPLLLVAVELCP